jgi:hypothetical protein
MRYRRTKIGWIEAVAITASVVAVLLFVTWQLASRPVEPEAGRLGAEVDYLGNELAGVKERMDHLQARYAVLEQETRVLREANRLLREQERERQTELNRLQAELDFFRRLAGTGGTQAGLDIYHVELFPTESARVFRFILTLTQNIRRASIVSGNVLIDLEGTVGDRPVTLSWSQLNDGNTPEPTFRFKYFEQLEGYLTLPEAFNPIRLKVTLEAEKRREPVQQAFTWRILLEPGETP